MSKELNDLAKEFGRESPTVKQANLSLYQTNISTASGTFLREVEYACKKMKQGNVRLIAVITEMK